MAESEPRQTSEKPAEKIDGRGKNPNSRANLKLGANPAPSKPPPTLSPDRTDNEEGIPSRLSVYRWVNEQVKALDDTDRKRRLRQWADENPVRFEDKLDALESEWAKSKRESEPSPTPKPTEETLSEAPFEELKEAWAQVQGWVQSCST